MMEQLSFNIAISDERKAFELIYPKLADIVYNAPMEADVLIFKELNDCSSVYFMSVNKIFFQIRLRKKSKYLLVPEGCADELPEGTSVSRVKSDAGMIRVQLASPEEILQYIPVLRTMLIRLMRQYSEFGCCGRYEACSDAKECIHPDIKFALGCKYRQNLMDGKIFYGKNQNI